MKMKAGLMCVVALLMLASATNASGPTGFGKTLAATTTTQTIALGNLDSVSVFNDDATEILHVLVNITIVEFDKLFAIPETIPIPPGTSYTFKMGNKDKRGINSVTFRTASGTATAYLASF